MKREGEKGQPKSAAGEKIFALWINRLVKAAAKEVAIAIDLFAENHAVLLKSPAELKRFRSEVSAEVGKQIAIHASDKLVELGVPSYFANLSRSHRAGVAGKLRVTHAGAPKAPWKVRATRLIMDRRTKLQDQTPDNIIGYLVEAGAIEEREDDSFWDVKAIPPKRCAKDENAMRAAIRKLVAEATNKKIVK